MLQLIKNYTSLALDISTDVEPEQILSGKKMFRPFMKFQAAWMKRFYPNDILDPQHDAWFYLIKYMMPLIEKYASSYHLNGIRALELDAQTPPNFSNFQKSFEHISNGFKIEPVTKEINPITYFKLIQQRKFPCISRVRSLPEIFCTNSPDFWHEAIGHIAPLCFPDVQNFYLEVADHLLSSKTHEEFDANLAVAWTLMEYGFLKQQGENKMFGAALVGSHLAHMRYINGLINIEPANRVTILESEFYSDKSPPAKNNKNNFRFFSMDNLQENQAFFKSN